MSEAEDDAIFIGTSVKKEQLLLRLANRHGLVTGVSKPFLEERAQKIGLENYSHDAFPVIFWDLFGVQGHLIRVTAGDRGHEKGRE